MNQDDRSDRDVRPRRRRGAYAAGLSAAVGAALAAAMIPTATAFADPSDDAIAAAAGDAAPAALQRSEEAILNGDITRFFGDIHDPSLAGPDIQLTDSLLSLLPGGVNGTDAMEAETFLVTDVYTPLIDAVGGGGMQAFDAAAGEAVPAAMRQSEEAVVNGDITTLADDIHDPSAAGPGIQFADFVFSLAPGGADGTTGIAAETFVATDVLTPLIDALGGGMMAF
jgi:hypothetical protein